jgi:Tol biopolymer transport system component
MGALPSETPAAVRMVVERCLRKNAKERLRDIGDVDLALTGAFDLAVPPLSATATFPSAVASQRPLWRRVGPAVALLVVGGLATAAAIRFGEAPDTRAQVTRFALGARGEAALHIDGNDLKLAITPDGSRVAYVGDSRRRLFVRALDQLDSAVIATGSVLRNPFVSPDGQWVGYNDLVERGSLWKVPIAGGPSVVISPSGGIVRGAVWLADNTIVFATDNRPSGLQRVSADGGTPHVLTAPDAARNEYDHYWPEALPDGHSVLYTVLARTGGLAAAKIAVYDLQTNTSTDLLRGGSNAMYLRSGHLVYVAGETLWAVPFDADRRIIRGTAAPVLGQLAMTGTGGGNFAVSATGTLAYAHTSGYDPFARTLSWIDRNGRLEPLGAPEHPYAQPRISHDGKRIVHGMARPPDNNLWVLGVSQGRNTRLRTEAARDQEPSWSPDDKWIVFASDRAGNLQIWRQAADGTGEPERLADSGVYPTVTPDGAQLIFTAPSSRGRGEDLMQMALDGSQRAEPLVQTSFIEGGADVSPDGRWLAHHSNLSGRQEVYIRPYPNVASGRELVSTAGGAYPLWSRDGRELFYMAPDGALMGVQVHATGSRWTATAPVKVLEPGYWSSGALIGRHYDVSPDGKRFLIVMPPRVTADPPDVVVVQHWNEELKALMPSK